MLADKHSFLGCTKILREVLGDKQQARSLQAFDLDKERMRIVIYFWPFKGSFLIVKNLFASEFENLTDMGLAFVKGNSNRLIYRFQSPFAEMPCRVQDIDMFVPNEYLTNIHIREKLADIKVLLIHNSCTQNRAASDR